MSIQDTNTLHSVIWDWFKNPTFFF